LADIFFAGPFLAGWACLGLVGGIFWLWMLIAALLYEPTAGDKILWFLVIFFLSILGAILYFFIRYSNRPKGSRPW